MNANRTSRLLGIVAAACVVGCVIARAQQSPGPSAAPPTDGGNRYARQEEAIRESAEAFTQAFNRGDAKALADLWTEQGEYIDETGAVTSGRPALESEFAAFFKERPKARMQVIIDSIQFLGPTIAVEKGTSRLSEPETGDTSAAHYKVLHVKENGHWLMASVHDQESTSLSNYGKLAPLNALIGDWTATGENGRVEMSCKWKENRNFIFREFTAYQGDKEAGGGLEIIGVDPSVGQITSWHFDREGGLGRSTWLRDGNRWVIKASGAMPDGRLTSATNVLTPVDRDTFTWVSYDRSVEGQPVPDTPIARIVRNKEVTRSSQR